MKKLLLAAATVFLATTIWAKPAATISGTYLEVRSCDVYTGPCFSNAEMGSNGKEAILTWSIKEGVWQGVDLAGLSVVAVVRTKDTLGDIKYAQPRGKTVLIVDARANPAQHAALAAFAKARAGKLIGKVLATRVEKITAAIGDCTKAGTCASVKAGKLVDITTRCLCNGDHVCGNEYLYYPPLTKIRNATAAFTQMFAYQGGDLGIKWTSIGQRGAFVGTFGR